MKSGSRERATERRAKQSTSADSFEFGDYVIVPITGERAQFIALSEGKTNAWIEFCDGWRDIVSVKALKRADI
jgi:hypothetical protein